MMSIHHVLIKFAVIGRLLAVEVVENVGFLRNDFAVILLVKMSIAVICISAIVRDAICGDVQKYNDLFAERVRWRREFLRHRIRSFSLCKKVFRSPLRVDLSTSKGGAGQFDIDLHILGERAAGASGVGGWVMTTDEKERFRTDFIHLTTRAASIEMPPARFF